MVILVENLPVPLDQRVWREASALRDAGWNVVVISPRGGSGMHRLHERIDGIEVLRYPQRSASGMAGYLLEYPPSLAFSVALFVWALARGRIDVVHGCNPPDLFFLLGMLGHRFGARYVYDQHDPSPELSLSKFGSQGAKARLVYRLTLMLEQASFRVADLVLTVNETCRVTALRRGRLRDDKVVVLPNAPNVPELRRHAAGAKPTGRSVGYVGVMGTHDGLDVLLDAWALLKRHADLEDATLELVGDGPARRIIERRLAGTDLAASVRLHGFQPPEVYAPIIAGCLVGVSPDLPTPFNNLSSMVKIMDYMALGRGCVAFDLQESRRLGGRALKVASSTDARGLAEALSQVLRDPQEASQLGAEATNRIRELEGIWNSFPGLMKRSYEALFSRESAETLRR